MSFHSSAENVRVDEGHLLRAQLRNMEGNLVDAELNLDQVLGNNFGKFEWGGENFSGSAQNISLHFEGEEENSSPILRAELHNSQGYVAHDVNLAERIGNNNGQFEFSKNQG